MAKKSHWDCGLDSIDARSDGNVIVMEAEGAGAIRIPGNLWLEHARFVRQGSDLLLVGKDGQQILVRDYFNSETPPALTTAHGGTFTPELVAKLAGPVAP